MTDVIDRTELLQRPAAETLPAMRALGMLPERTTDRVWVPDPVDIQPSFGPLCQINPLQPFTAGGLTVRLQPAVVVYPACPRCPSGVSPVAPAASSISTSPAWARAASASRGWT